MLQMSPEVTIMELETLSLPAWLRRMQGRQMTNKHDAPHEQRDPTPRGIHRRSRDRNQWVAHADLSRPSGAWIVSVRKRLVRPLAG